MGTAISCYKCQIPEETSVINMSDAIIFRIVEGYQPVQTKCNISIDDSDWISKLKCLDNKHSDAYGLNQPDLLRLIGKVEQQIRDGGLHDYCPSNIIQDCYKRNPSCSLQCSKEVEDFIECIDLNRLQKLQNMQHARKKKEKMDNLAKTKRNKH